MRESIDVYEDYNHQQLYVFEQLCGLPEFVKKAELEPKAQLASLSSDAFADPRHRRFPCHTKAATWLANAYFQRAKPSYSKDEAGFVQGRITKMASYWSIAGLVDQFNKAWVKYARAEMPELSDDQYALVVEVDGRTLRRMPMPNAPSVKAAGEYLYANRFNYPYAWRKSAARRILKEALRYDQQHASGVKVAGTLLGVARFSAPTLEYLERAAGFAGAHPTRVAEKLAHRVTMLKSAHPNHALKLAELAKAVHSLEFVSTQALAKIATTLDQIDQETGLARQYIHGIELPEEALYSILQKDAEAVLDNHVVLATGRSFPLGALLQVPLEKISSVLGADVGTAISAADGSLDPVKFAEIARTLPRNDAALLERMITEAVKFPPSTAVKEARAGLAANLAFDKESLVKQFKSEGRKVSEEDFTLTIRKG